MYATIWEYMYVSKYLSGSFNSWIIAAKIY